MIWLNLLIDFYLFHIFNLSVSYFPTSCFIVSCVCIRCIKHFTVYCVLHGMQENAFNIHLDEDKMFGWGEVPLRFGLGQESISKTNSKLFKISPWTLKLSIEYMINIVKLRTCIDLQVVLSYLFLNCGNKIFFSSFTDESED